MSSNIHTLNDRNRLPPNTNAPAAADQTIKKTIIIVGTLLALGIILSVVGPLILKGLTHIKSPFAQISLNLLGNAMAILGGILTSICIMLIIMIIIKRAKI